MVLQPADYTEFLANTEKSVGSYLKRIAENLTATSQLEVRYEFFTGEPASIIVDRAKALNVDAIVMSTHGRSGFSRWLFGSVTQKVLNAMPCPVLVVPGAKKVSTQERAAIEGAIPAKA
jgi:nucleotide-binding universal stress UspA family protein